jgi:hypothetical protein
MSDTFEGWFEVGTIQQSLGQVTRTVGKVMTVVDGHYTTVYLPLVGTRGARVELYEKDPEGGDVGSWGVFCLQVYWDDDSEQWEADGTTMVKDCDGRRDHHRHARLYDNVDGVMFWDWSDADTRDHAAEAAGY